jgi:hypothetical protein
MPAIGKYDLTHVNKLSEIGIEILEEYKGAKTHIQMKCKTCGFEFIATPLAKIQVHKKYPNSNGCDMCRRAREDKKYQPNRDNVLQLLKDANLTILTPGYKGQRKNVYEKIRVKNEDCGHTFDLCIGNFLHGLIRTTCTICGIKNRAAMLTKIANQVHAKWLETADEWHIFKYEACMLTEKTYRSNKQLINPFNHPRGKAGIDGAYQLDHIISRRYCFDNNIPSELCAHPDNLRFIPWLENIKKGKHIVTEIPLIFDAYIDSSSVVDWDEEDTVEEQKLYDDIEANPEKVFVDF